MKVDFSFRLYDRSWHFNILPAIEIGKCMNNVIEYDAYVAFQFTFFLLTVTFKGKKKEKRKACGRCGECKEKEGKACTRVR